MKKRRGRGNPLAEYRRIQREMRAVFDPFTAKHCPGCAAPCCVKPMKVTPVDVALALNTGHTFPHFAGNDPYAPALSDASHRLGESAIPLPMAGGPEPVEYCEFLVNGRCSFPDDLRPFGCTTYLCQPMYANLPNETLRKLRRLSRQLEDAHTALLWVLGRIEHPGE
ncbi:MAG TPA: hypothetical protein VFW40_03080 [Capsulimonadaceae bacterium]|nr:hypothetical protein [Capsulimonadaceae bacterium]